VTPYRTVASWGSVLSASICRWSETRRRRQRRVGGGEEKIWSEKGEKGVKRMWRVGILCAR
jgi:hypothetical protein